MIVEKENKELAIYNRTLTCFGKRLPKFDITSYRVLERKGIPHILTQKPVGSVGGGPIRRLSPKSDLSAVWAPKVKACVIGGGGRVVVLAF